MKSPILFFSVVILLFSACQKPQEPAFKRMQNFNVGEVKGNQVEIFADAVLENPNNINAEVVFLDIDMIMQEKIIGKINDAKQVKVPANSEFIVPVKIMASVDVIKQNWLTSAISILSNGKVPVKFSGFVTIKVLKIPFKVPVDFTEHLKVEDLRVLIK